MRKELINMGLVIGLSTSLFGFTYEIKEGWQQLGAVENIDDVPNAFKDSCIDYLWYYKNNGPNPADGEWKLHIVNETDYNYDAYCGEKLTELKKGQGFWAKANTDCSINVGTATNCDSDMPAPPDLDKPECISCDANVSNPSERTTETFNVPFNGKFKSMEFKFSFKNLNIPNNAHLYVPVYDLGNVALYLTNDKVNLYTSNLDSKSFDYKDFANINDGNIHSYKIEYTNDKYTTVNIYIDNILIYTNTNTDTSSPMTYLTDGSMRFLHYIENRSFEINKTDLYVDKNSIIIKTF